MFGLLGPIHIYTTASVAPYSTRVKAHLSSLSPNTERLHWAASALRASEIFKTMEEEYAVDDPTQLLEAASESSKRRFPLPVVLKAFSKQDMVRASLIPQYMVTRLLKSLSGDAVSAHLITDNNIYPLLLNCLINGNEQVATLSMEAIKKIAGCPAGTDIVFPADSNEATLLGKLVSECSSLGRIRVLALIVQLFSVSPHVASVISKSNLPGLFEAEIKSNDTLAALIVMELLYELSDIEHARVFLSTSILLQLLSSIISDKSMDSILRSRAMMISGR